MVHADYNKIFLTLLNEIKMIKYILIVKIQGDSSSKLIPFLFYDLVVILKI